jgi:SAM-dependent methyltransferase
VIATDDRAAIAGLRDVLAGAGYDPDGVRRALGSDGPFERDDNLPLYLRVLPEEGPLPTLVRLFFLGVPVAEEAAAAAFAPLPLGRLEGLGLLEERDGGVGATVDLTPTDEFLLAYDHGEHGVERPEHVLGISPGTKLLAYLTNRRPVERALDLGSGSGVQAILAAKHARSVVAVDVNPRALEFTAFNALLNGFENVECRLGDLFEPVEGERFDLLVCNPPYVVSPETSLVYRDSGLPGDAFCERLVRRVPEFLTEGGYAHVLVSWVHGGNDDWTARLRDWVDGSGCDALLLRFRTHEPLAYAAGSNARLRRRDPEEFARVLDRWTAYYDDLGIEAISWGALVLRRRAGENWVWSHLPSAERVGPASSHVLRLVEGQDRLRALPDERALLDEALDVVPSHRLDQTVVLRRGDEDVEASLLRLLDGLRFQVAVDGPTTRVLSLLDGRRTLRDVLEEAAALEPGLEPEAALPGIRQLLELGFLE